MISITLLNVFSDASVNVLIPFTGTERGGDLLLLLLGLPIFTVFFLVTSASFSRDAQYALGLGSSVVSLLASLVLAGSIRGVGFHETVVFQVRPSRFVNFRFGVDGISLPFILLTNLFQYLCILSLSPSTPRILDARLALFLLQAGVLATFVSLDILAFFFFFELTLLPIYFLVLRWGSRERRVRASYLIALYTLFGSIFRFFNLLYLRAKTGTTDYELLLQLSFNSEDQRFLWITFFLAFAAKVPLFPLHVWLPEAHVEAPTVGSVLLAVLLLKLGTYGLVRFALPLFPEGTVYFGPIVSTFAVRGIIFTCFTAMRQIDLKKIIAYSSVGHINVVLLGLIAETSEGLQGGLFQRVSHGVVSGALFFAVGVIYERYSVRSLKYFGGLAHLIPLFTVVFLLFSLANIAFPLTSSFVGEFIIFLGLSQHNLLATVFASTSMVLGAVYTLWTANRLLFGNLRTLSISAGQDLNRKEASLFATLTLVLLWRGIAPQTLLDRFLIDSMNILEHARLGRR